MRVIYPTALKTWEALTSGGITYAGLLIATLLGFIPANEAFLGFGHPAVVTVAAVLIISRGLSNTGATVTTAGCPNPKKASLAGINPSSVAINNPARPQPV